ncbi:facilitated trehalose transporter Tret1-2 homolog [Bacillus rossius redtenbacheri]|uniref:facilitated trehalose transporter Tret1-2 homolog n=1 Tax=Bacillus rossius redtenbacheri TaxID=93214 RepID=UPI002FDE83CC
MDMEKSEKTYVPNKHGKRTNLYVTAAAVNILSFLAGIAFGWMATMQSVLQGPGSPVGPISDQDASWLASIINLSRLVTIPLYMWSVERLGRRATGYLVAAPFLVSYVLPLFAGSVAGLYCARRDPRRDIKPSSHARSCIFGIFIKRPHTFEFQVQNLSKISARLVIICGVEKTEFVSLPPGRFVVGIAAGGAFILAPAYVSDIAEDSNKGRLGVLFGLSLNLGLTFSYAAGSYASYYAFHACCAEISAAALLVLRCLPESPLFLLAAGRAAEARDALRWLRGGEDCGLELERMASRARELLDRRDTKVSLTALTDRATLRGLLIGLGLMANQQLSGNAPVMVYTVSIFEQAGSTIPPHVCAITVGALTTAGTLVSSAVIDRCGRRALLIASDLVFALSLGLLGAYFYLRHLGWDVATVGWLPLACLSAHVFTTGLGFSSLPFTVATELVGPRARGAVQTAMLMFLSASVFAVLFCYGPVSRAVGQHGCFWFFSAACAVSAACIYLAMPETKNRSVEEVVAQLGGDHYVRSVVTWSKHAAHVQSIL